MKMELRRERLEDELERLELETELKILSRTPTTIAQRYSGRNQFHGGNVSSVYDSQGNLLEKRYEVINENGESRLAKYVNLRRD